MILLTGLFISFLLGRFDSESRLSNEKIKVLSELTTIRAKLIGEVTSTFNLTQGMTHLINYMGDISLGLFNAMSKQAIQENRHIRNIALAPDNVIRWVYPLKGNERAIGLKYMDNAEQKPSVLKAMEAKTPILAGPVNLVQGGIGFINRSPIFIKDEKENTTKYWGVASIVAYYDTILYTGGISNSKSLNILLRGKDGLGEKGDIIWGDTLILHNNPVFIDVFIPGGKWQLLATPANGWTRFRFYNSNYFLFGLIFTLMISSLLMVLIYKNQDIRNKNEDLAYEIAERKRIEKELVNSKELAESANRMKTVFLANMSHEIRTPMNAILGFTDLMLNRNLSISDSNRYLEIINSSTRQLLNVINDIIDISIIETGQLKININPVNINVLLKNCIDLNTGLARKKNLDIKLKLSLPDQTAVIYIDEFRLNQILNNLVVNAIKYTHQGWIEVGYYLSDNFVEFFVRDTGIGIAPEHHHEIFEIFRQVDDTNNNQLGGTGLGLAISKSLVEKMGGKIWLDSVLNDGSTFYFTIPYNPVDVPQRFINKHFESEHLNLSDKQIMIVEDDFASYTLIKDSISVTNAKVYWAKNGKDVNELIKQNTFDLMFLDIKLPGKNGIEIVKELRGNGLKIPIIAQTAFALNEDKEKALDAGFDYYITKPIDQHFLIELLKIIFEKTE